MTHCFLHIWEGVVPGRQWRERHWLGHNIGLSMGAADTQAIWSGEIKPACMPLI
jgi:hypothetical protein